MLGALERGKRKTTESGTDYGGQQGDIKKLPAGCKKSEKESSKYDTKNLHFLEQIDGQLKL